jgi:hypothetical protein
MTFWSVTRGFSDGSRPQGGACTLGVVLGAKTAISESQAEPRNFRYG